ncbi:MAG TPA: FecR domain-containing protein, partial [Desulfurivibrionaceae bacterium]
MKQSITSTLFLGFFVLILAWSPAYAAEQVATVVAARGDVQALDAKGKGRALTIKAPIFADDTIKTKEHSRVQIMFTDNTLINLGNETTMKIAEYRWQPEQNDGALKTQIKEGTFRVMGGALTKTAPQNFKTETPTATIGIRGSMYAGVVTPDFLSVVFQGGKGIDITNAFGTVEISKPGFGTKVAMTKPPLPPMKFTAKEMGELNKALSGNGAGEKEEEKKEKGEDKGKKEDTSPEKAPAPKEGEGTAPAPAEQQSSTAPAPDDAATFNSWGATTMDPVMETTPPVLDPVTFTPPPLIPPIPVDVIKEMGVINTQDVVNTTTSETAATTVVSNTALTGNYRFFLRDVDLTLADPGDFNSTLVYPNVGTVGVKLFDNGELYGTLSDGTSFGPYLINGYNPNATSYTGFASFTDTITYLAPTVGSLNLTVTTVGEPSGQFFYNTFYYTIDSIAPSPDFLLGQLLYAGIPSTSIPTSGIDMFTGHLIYNNTLATDPDADMEKTSIEVNYYNKRLIGRSKDMNPATTKNDGAVFFGTVNSNGTADVIILGGGGDSGGGTNPTATYGTASANLYGSFNQGLGFTASGADYVINDNTLHSTWQATGAALRDATTEIISSYPTSPIPYTGFVVGVADNTATGAVSRIFMNSDASDFTMSANPTTGAISGFLSANELLGTDGLGTGSIPLSNITIGHPTDLTKSAYVLNDQMVAILSDADPNYALSNYGNFLYTAGPDAPLITNASNEFMTWGYWEMAYTDPVDSSKDHLFSS